MTGCASFINETTHPMRIETWRADGTAVEGAECKLTNEHGTFTAYSGETSQVRRSNRDLDISCQKAGEAPAVGRAISRTNAGFVGNLILGGAIGAVVDHGNGKAYSYPTWIRLVFGKTLVFDRSNEREGQVLQGAEFTPSPPGR